MNSPKVEDLNLRETKSLQEPLVLLVSGGVLVGSESVGDTVEMVDNGASKIVHGVGLVLGALSSNRAVGKPNLYSPSNVVRSLDVSEDNRVSHRSVLVLVVDLGSSGPLSTLLSSLQELVEPSQVVLDRVVSVLGRDLCPSLLLDLKISSMALSTQRISYSLSVRVVHEQVALLDELLGVLDDLVKVVRSVDNLVVSDVNHLEVLLDSRLEFSLRVSGAHD